MREDSRKLFSLRSRLLELRVLTWTSATIAVLRLREGTGGGEQTSLSEVNRLQRRVFSFQLQLLLDKAVLDCP